METYKCPHCNNTIELSNKEQHLKYCIEAPSENEYENLIPCEICDSFIPFDEYSSHIETCGQPINFFNMPIPNQPSSLVIEDTLQNLFSNITINISNISNNLYVNPSQENLEDNFRTINFSDLFRFNSINSIYEDNSYDELMNICDEIGDVIKNIENIDDVSKSVEKKETCPICQEEFNEVRETVCNHVFCQECLKEWLSENSTCPICLKDFLEK